MTASSAVVATVAARIELICHALITAAISLNEASQQWPIGDRGEETRRDVTKESKTDCVCNEKQVSLTVAGDVALVMWRGLVGWRNVDGGIDLQSSTYSTADVSPFCHSTRYVM